MCTHSQGDASAEDKLKQLGELMDASHKSCAEVSDLRSDQIRSQIVVNKGGLP